MHKEAVFDWIPFYTEFADALKGYKNDRKTLIEKLRKTYAGIGLRLPKLDSVEPSDIDPFTVFGLFNKGITDANRIKIIEGLRTEFKISAAAPAEFDGVPVLNNLSATFYRFEGGRGDSDIDILWTAFETALSFADNENETTRSELISAIDEARKLSGVKWNLTIGFYWIRPHSFLNLDGRNRWALGAMAMLGEGVAEIVNSLKDQMPAGEAYLQIRDACLAAFGEHAYRGFPEFSLDAWTESERVNAEKRAAKAREEESSGICERTAEQETPSACRRVWVYAPGEGACAWDEFREKSIMGIGWDGLGDLSSYKSLDEIALRLREIDGLIGSRKNDSLACWQFEHDMHPGDIVYAKRGTQIILGRGVVLSDSRFEPDRDQYRHVRDVEWNAVGKWDVSDLRMPLKTLTDWTPYQDLVSEIEKRIGASDSEEANESSEYTDKDFLAEVYLDATDLSKLKELLRRKKNLILQGAPGTGKTFAAKRLAYAMMGCKDDSRIQQVQFHQGTSYDDFVYGYRPNDAGGFDPTPGVFVSFCRRAAARPGEAFFVIIDEINRANISKVFGELLMLIEADHRGDEVTLTVSGERFSVPKNVYLVGMMNTADRGLALIDYALRRRFAFFEMEPALGNPAFLAEVKKHGERMEKLVHAVASLNDDIASDPALGRGFRIGHSYFCVGDDAPEDVAASIVEYEIVPLVEEYWFDDEGKVEAERKRLEDAIK